MMTLEVAKSAAKPLTFAPRTGARRIAWAHVASVLSVAVLIVVEMFAVAYALGSAIGHLLEVGDSAKRLIQGMLMALGAAFAGYFVRRAVKVEPFMLPR